MSNDKGFSFERKVAKILNTRFSSILDGKDGFVRNLGSGARFGGKNSTKIGSLQDEHKLVGDISTPPDFKFVIECKHYKDSPTFRAVLNEQISQWDGWIKQVETDAKSVSKVPMLVIKYNLINEFVMLPSSVLLISTFSYKGYGVIKLKDLLNAEDSFFFKKDSK